MNAASKKIICPGCRKVVEVSVHRDRCKPCYNEWFRRYRLERMAQVSEAKLITKEDN